MYIVVKYSYLEYQHQQYHISCLQCVCVYIYSNWYYHRADSSDWEFLTREIYLANYPIRFTRILKLCHHFRNSVVAIMEHMMWVSNHCRKCPLSMYLNLTISIYYIDRCELWGFIREINFGIFTCENISFFPPELLLHNYKCDGYVPCCVTVNTHAIVNWKNSAKCHWRLWHITNMTSLTSYEDFQFET